MSIKELQEEIKEMSIEEVKNVIRLYRMTVGNECKVEEKEIDIIFDYMLRSVNYE